MSESKLGSFVLALNRWLIEAIEEGAMAERQIRKGTAHCNPNATASNGLQKINTRLAAPLEA